MISAGDLSEAGPVSSISVAPAQLRPRLKEEAGCRVPAKADDRWFQRKKRPGLAVDETKNTGTSANV